MPRWIVVRVGRLGARLACPPRRRESPASEKIALAICASDWSGQRAHLLLELQQRGGVHRHDLDGRAPRLGGEARAHVDHVGVDHRLGRTAADLDRDLDVRQPREQALVEHAPAPAVPRHADGERAAAACRHARRGPRPRSTDGLEQLGGAGSPPTCSENNRAKDCRPRLAVPSTRPTMIPDAEDLQHAHPRQAGILPRCSPGKVRMYVCGMTVYDYCHLGHARVMVVFDMVTRWLRASGSTSRTCATSPTSTTRSSSAPPRTTRRSTR